MVVCLQTLVKPTLFLYRRETSLSTLLKFNAENFRGISISPTISKLFEHAVPIQFSRYFFTSEYKFGF